MGSMDKWRKFFEGAGADIWSVIEYAIVVAASDRPKEFRRRRDRIAQRLYVSRMVRCCECDAVTLAEPEDVDEDDDIKGVLTECHDKDNDKVTSSTDDADMNRVSNYSYDEAEALTEEIEEESQVLREVYRIKDILANPDESDNQLYESLRRLELMQLSVETLKATEIGKQVNRLRKHSSKEIRSMVKMLISGWKDLVDEWVKTAGNVAAAAIAGTSPDSVSPAVVDDENGLPSPPLDEGAFLATQTTSIEISKFFDGMDDDGNPRIAEELENEECDYGEKRSTVEHYHNRKQSVYQSNVTRDGGHCGKHETVVGNMERGEMRSSSQIQADSDLQSNRVSSSNRTIGSSGPGRPLNKPKSPDDASARVKFEAAKRRLQEGYQQAENAKKQRTVQVMDLQDLPKQGSNHAKPFLGKPSSQNRQWMNNRRDPTVNLLMRKVNIHPSYCHFILLGFSCDFPVGPRKLLCNPG
eukprot:Gb_30192 [translate_table: standard]